MPPNTPQTAIMHGSSEDDGDSEEDDSNMSVETPPPRPHVSPIVTIEEDSDEGSLLKAFTVWRSGLVFASNTKVRRSSKQSEADATAPPESTQNKDELSASAQLAAAPPPPSPAPAVVAPSDAPTASPTAATAAAVPQQQSLPVVPFTLSANPPVPPDTELLPNGLPSIVEETESTCTELRNKSSIMKKGSFLSMPFSGNDSNGSTSSKGENSSFFFADLAPEASVGAAGMGQADPDQVGLRDGASIHSSATGASQKAHSTSALGMGSFQGQAMINPFRGANNHQGALEDYSSASFYTRTGAQDSKYRVYHLDVDPTQGDRAADIPLFSFARPHMRGFHLAWMSFFVSFFTWFAMTPLLSEIARSLDFTRKEIFMSSVLAVLSSAFTRIWIGPLNDTYGARWMMCLTLIAAGSSFVTCQYWTLSMFTKEIAGTANALAAGWGNLGGGVAQVVMGSLLFPLSRIAYGGSGYGSSSGAVSDDDEFEYDRSSELAWRTVLVFPAILSFVMAYLVIRYGDDTPKGNAICQRLTQQNISHPAPPSPFVTVWENFRHGASNLNTFLLSFQYGCCFGVEITMTQTAALYFADEFGQSTESAAAIASVFGWMNLFARGIGGFCSDWANAHSGLRGRLRCQVGLLVAEGCLVILFSFANTLGGAIAVMVIFSIFVQAAEGSTFGIVPYVDSTVAGSVAGLVGAGGNIGGACFAAIFVYNTTYQRSFLWMGCIVVASAILTSFVAIPGHRRLFSGRDSDEIIEHRENAKPPAIVMIPATRNGDGDEHRDDDNEEKVPERIESAA